MPFWISVDHVTIFSSNPMQQLRWNIMWQQIGNSWKLLRTVVTKSFFLNVSGLLDPTLKCMPSIQSDIYLFKLSKKDTRTMCQLYLKLRIRAPERPLGLLLLTLNMFCSLFYCYYYWTNKCRLGLRKLVSDSKFVYSNCMKRIVLWIWKFCWATSFHPYSTNIRLRKDKFPWQHFKKIHRTLEHKVEIN